jgi:large subunit ribosomal protein L9
MKVLLLEDVYKLGRAGDVKKVADGFGRNYLIPQNLAALATPGALKQVEHIKARAAASRNALNKEMSGVAGKLEKLTLTFPARAGETGKLYGSITTQMISDAINSKLDVSVDRRQVDAQPIRTLGEHSVRVHLTVDLVPEVRVIVHREGESVESALVPSEPEPSEDVPPVATQTESAAEVAEPEDVVPEAEAPVEPVADVAEVDQETEAPE